MEGPPCHYDVAVAEETPRPPRDSSNEDEDEFQDLDEPDTPDVEPGNQHADDADETPLEDCIPSEEPPEVRDRGGGASPRLGWAKLVSWPRGPFLRPWCHRPQGRV